MSRFRLRTLALWLLGTLVGAYFVASIDWCVEDAGPPSVLASGRGEGRLEVGTGQVELLPELPIVRAGYGPIRPDAASMKHPLFARALVLRAGGTDVGIVSLDLLLVPPELVAAIRAGAAPLGLSTIWVLATHSHSSFGGFDERWVPSLAGAGRFDADVRTLLVDGAVSALRAAEQSRAPAELEIADGVLPGVVSRTDSPHVDSRLTRIRFVRDGAKVAEWVIAAAHPTLVPRDVAELDPDFPGAFSRARHTRWALFSQGAVGNASAETVGDGPWERVEELGRRVALAADQARPIDAGSHVLLGWAQLRVPLPEVDAQRLVPGPWERPTEAALCASSSASAELGVLQLGSLRLLAVPAEVTAEVGEALAAAAGADRVLSLANGYLGYVETPERVRAGTGEARRQYYDAELATSLVAGARVASEAISTGP